MSNNLSWQDVVAAHGSRAAIVQKNGRISSILCGGQDYADVIDANEVIYQIPNRAFYKKSIESFKACREFQYSFQVYQKIQTNKWRYLGEHKVKNMEISGDYWKLYLVEEKK